MKKVLIETEDDRLHIALTKGGELLDYRVEKGEDGGLGSIYCGVVSQVLPEQEACFIQIGPAQTAYLSWEDADRPVKRGEKLVVQIKREAGWGKRPRVTTDIQLAGQFLVYLPMGRRIAISQKIEAEPLRQRLTAWFSSRLKAPEGVVVRTAAQCAEWEVLAQELDRLRRCWATLTRAAKRMATPGLLETQGGVLGQVIRDWAVQPLHWIVKGEETYGKVASMLEQVVIPMRSRLHESSSVSSEGAGGAHTLTLYQGTGSLFEAEGLTRQIQGLYQRKVRLKGGGVLIIDEMEALTVIDVDAGRTKGADRRHTILQVNLEAAREAARQIRLRDLGGIILIDFIDQKEEDDRRHVLSVLQEALKTDPQEVHVIGYTALGLVELTRKKLRASLWQRRMRPCPHCQGRGRILVAEDACKERHGRH